MRRRQELPEQAFVPSAEAVEMLDRGDRSILVLSHCWHTPSHPDPLGVTLAAVRRFLRKAEGARACGIFIECVAAGSTCGMHVVLWHGM